jgi:hypothetical protein
MSGVRAWLALFFYLDYFTRLAVEQVVLTDSIMYVLNCFTLFLHSHYVTG